MKHRGFIPLLVLCLLAALAGCKSQKPSANGTVRSPGGISPEGLAESSNRFAMDLFRQVQAPSDNLVFSPYSIHTVMAMVYSGAHGETAEQMSGAMYVPSSDMLDPAEKELKDLILSGDSLPGTEISLANAIWAQEGFGFLPEYMQNLSRWYDAPLTELDFILEDSREESRKRINLWVEEETRQKIRDLIGPGVLDADTRMVLTNAIYFNGKWKWSFDENSTTPAIFRVSPQQTLMTDFMHMAQTLPYYEDEDVQCLILPYREDRFSMMVILPRSVDGWKMVSRVLDRERLRKMEERFEPTEVYLSFPKFTVELKMNLSRELSAMGMHKAFSHEADFSGMNGEKNLFIDEVIHKAFIEVSEKGTEAAAATGAVISLKSSLREPLVRFNADHPFLYFIRDERTGCIIFLGRLVRPS